MWRSWTVHDSRDYVQTSLKSVWSTLADDQPWVEVLRDDYYDPGRDPSIRDVWQIKIIWSVGDGPFHESELSKILAERWIFILS